MSDEPRIRPVIILPPKTVSKRDIQRLCDNGFCVVVAKNPADVRFLDSLPVGYTDQERAAIELSRQLLTLGTSTSNWSRYSIAERFVEILMAATPLVKKPVTPVATVKKPT